MYKLPVRLEGIERRRRSTTLLHIVTGFFLVAVASRYYSFINYGSFLSVLPIYLTAVISGVYGFLQRRKDPAARYNQWVRLLQFLCFTGIGVSMIKETKNYSVFILFIWAVIVLALSVTERKIFQPADLQLKRDGIAIPGYFTDRAISWMVIERVVVRPDYVTFFRTNQSFLQLELAAPMSRDDIARVQAFCNAQIGRHIQFVDN